MDDGSQDVRLESGSVIRVEMYDWSRDGRPESSCAI
jgi:hypothetical protein